ncbi:uncharacterized protein NH340_JMT03817 [Sarcoptes scabiei]|nr:uncharacterized protein NH340_JMT03817 [Sarcoptes scabiei]
MALSISSLVSFFYHSKRVAIEIRLKIENKKDRIRNKNNNKSKFSRKKEIFSGFTTTINNPQHTHTIFKTIGAHIARFSTGHRGDNDGITTNTRKMFKNNNEIKRDGDDDGYSGGIEKCFENRSREKIQQFSTHTQTHTYIQILNERN